MTTHETMVLVKLHELDGTYVETILLKYRSETGSGLLPAMTLWEF